MRPLQRQKTLEQGEHPCVELFVVTAVSLFGDLPAAQKPQCPLLFQGHHAVTGSSDGDWPKQNIMVRSEGRSGGTHLDGGACCAHWFQEDRVLKDQGPGLAEPV